MRKILKGINPIVLSKEKLDWMSEALSINFEEHDDEWLLDHNFHKDDHVGIAGVDFEDGSTIIFDLWSGSSNYWDDWTLYDKNEVDIWQFNPSFEISAGEIEFYCDDNDTVYLINIEVKNSED